MASRTKNATSAPQAQPTPAAKVWSSKPTAATALLIIGGAIILLSALAELSSVSYLSTMNASTISELNPNITLNASTISAINALHSYGPLFDTLALLGIVSGVVLILAGVLAYMNPARTKLVAAVGVVFSLLSLGSLGGFIIGFIIAIAGSILAWIFKPTG